MVVAVCCAGRRRGSIGSDLDGEHTLLRVRAESCKSCNAALPAASQPALRHDRTLLLASMFRNCSRRPSRLIIIGL